MTHEEIIINLILNNMTITTYEKAAQATIKFDSRGFDAIKLCAGRGYSGYSQGCKPDEEDKKTLAKDLLSAINKHIEETKEPTIEQFRKDSKPAKTRSATTRARKDSAKQPSKVLRRLK
jgi:hypothetical protein